MMKRSWAPLLSIACALIGFSQPAAAQVAGALNLNAGFTPDPAQVSGVSGGPVSAQGVNSNCRGYIPATPSHVLVTQSGFRFLRVFVESAGDTTLMVRGINGTWCADDTYGLNPGLDLSALPPNTRYDIYVGSYSASGSPNPYRLTLSELQSTVPGSGGAPPPPDNNNANNGDHGDQGNGMRGVPSPGNPNLPPGHGRIALSGPLRTPRTASGRTGGAQNASNIRGRGTCRGFIDDAPSFVMTVTQPQRFMRMFVTSAADTTLVVQYPDGSVACSDDSFNGLHPSLDGEFPPGTYYIWVGIYRESMIRPFRLTLTPNPNQHP